jgi:hypothetical protein
MSKNHHNNNPEEGQDYILVHHEHRPYWKRMHHTWSFWIFLFLMLACITYYIVSVNFSLAPQLQIK